MRNCRTEGSSTRSRYIALAAVASCLAFAAAGIAQENGEPMAASVAPWFTMVQQSFVSLADAMPAERYGFKPTNGAFMDARTFGEQVKHVACANYAFFNEIEKKEPPPDCASGGPSPARTKAELVTYLRESFDYAQAVLRQISPASRLTRSR